MNSVEELDKSIRRIPDFPKPGVMFYDITSILINPEAFHYCISRMHQLFDQGGFDAIAAIEARGFFFASPFAAQNSLPLLPIRKAGKLPGSTLQKSFSLEYGQDSLEVHTEDVEAGWKVLLVDDLIATGGTTNAALELLTDSGATNCETFSVVGLPFLGYPKVVTSVKIHTLIEYEGE